MSQQIIAHVEIPTTSLEESAVFFKKVFEWEFREFGRGYQLYNTQKGMTIGLRKVESIAAGDTTIFHVNVDDVEKYCDLAKMAGGTVFRGKTTIPVYGYYALIRDAQGNTIGLFQPNH